MKPTPPTVLDENGVLVLVDGSDLRPSSPVRRQYPRRCWEHPAGVVVTPKETLP